MAADGAPLLELSKAVYFEVPGQPQGKGRPRVGKIGDHARMFTPAKTLAYEGFIALQAQIAMQGHDLIEGPVLVRMLIACTVPGSWSQKKQRAALADQVFPTTKPDTDNVIKAVFDACNGVVWKDDVQAVDLELRKRYREAPGVWVEVLPIVATVLEKPAQQAQGELLAAA
jgi:Holliday junction resolvase RusA-like endonuclease